MVLLKSFSHGIVQSVETSVWLFLRTQKSSFERMQMQHHRRNDNLLLFFTCTFDFKTLEIIYVPLWCEQHDVDFTTVW